MFTANAPLLQTAGGVSVQIVQVIPRRGTNFFDRANPTGQGAVVAQAGGGGAPPAPPAPPTEVCGAQVFTDGLGVPSLVAPPNAGLQIDFVPGFRAFVMQAPGSTWDSFVGAPFLSAAAITEPGSGTAVYVLGCPFNTSSNQFAVRMQVKAANPNVVCVQRAALTAQNCNAQGN